MKKIFIFLAIVVLSATTTKVFAANTEAMLQYNQGIDYYKIGQYDQAIDCFRNAVRLDPNYVDAYYNLGSVLEYLQQYDAALPIFKQIIVRKPDDYDAVYKAAWLSYKLGEPQKARTYLSIIPANSPRSKDAQILLAQLPASKPVISAPPKAKLNQSSGLYQGIAAPTGITSDTDGNLYVAEFNNNAIIKIAPSGEKILFVKNPQISGPIGLAMDNSKNLYIANYNKDNILKIGSNGEVSALISNVKKPYCLYISDGMLFVSSQGSDSVLRYKLP